jgi:acetyl-CoA C-acetyltransferase
MEAYVFDVVRTPRGRGKEGGALAGTKPIELLSGLFGALGKRIGLTGAHIDDVILGCSTPKGEQGANIARIAALYAGFGERASGTTVNRFCASGFDALHTAASRVASGMAECIVAGGVESLSRVPMMSDGGAWFEDREVAKKTGFLHMAMAADLLATKEKLARVDLDAFAARSQRLAAGATERKAFARELVPVTNAEGAMVLGHDECVRPGATPEKLAAMAPLFVPGAPGERTALSRFPELGALSYVHTVGTSPAMADGASLSVVGSRAFGERLGLRPRARILSFAEIAHDPVLMLGGNPQATQTALDRARAGLAPVGLADVDLFEVGESFAAVPVHYARTLDLPMDRINVNGGALALGHPLGATGVILLGTLLSNLEAQGKTLGVMSICAAAGIASATVVERLS